MRGVNELRLRSEQSHKEGGRVVGYLFKKRTLGTLGTL